MNTVANPHNYHAELKAARTRNEVRRVQSKVPFAEGGWSWSAILKAQREKVCNQCGGKLNITWTFNGGCCLIIYRYRILVCRACSSIARPVTPERFELASRLVREFGYRPYSHMDKHEYERMGDLEGFYRSQTGAAYDLIDWFEHNAVSPLTSATDASGK